MPFGVPGGFFVVAHYDVPERVAKRTSAVVPSRSRISPSRSRESRFHDLQRLLRPGPVVGGLSARMYPPAHVLLSSTTCSLHDMLPPRHAPSTTCSLHDMLPPRHAPSTTCSLHDMLPPRDAPSTTCSLHDMLPPRHAPSTTCSLYNQVRGWGGES